MTPNDQATVAALSMLYQPHYIVVVGGDTELPGYPGRTASALIRGVPFMTGTRIKGRELPPGAIRLPGVSTKGDPENMVAKEIDVVLDPYPNYEFTVEGKEAIIEMAWSLGSEDACTHSSAHANLFASAAEHSRRNAHHMADQQSIGIAPQRGTHDTSRWQNASGFG